MKIVREHINEKFTQESDPIKDLGIGSKFYNIKPGDIIRSKKPIRIPNAHEIALQDIQTGYFQTNRHAAVIKVDKLKKGILTLTIAFFGDIENALKAKKVILTQGGMHYYTRTGTAPIEKWEEFFEVLDINENLRINEKFTEDSDPISDMEIGEEKNVKLAIDKLLIGKHHYWYIPKITIPNNGKKIVIGLRYRCTDTDWKKRYKEILNDFISEVKLDKYITDRRKIENYRIFYNFETPAVYILNSKDEYVDLFKKLKGTYHAKINEKFTQDSDPIQDLGIGRKQLIEKWIKKMNDESISEMGIKTAIINDDLTISLTRGSSLPNNCGDLPEYIQFKRCESDFNVNTCDLTTLRGMPEYIGGSFNCRTNKLKTLKYSPKIVGRNYICDENLIKFTKEDVKKVCKVKGYIDC